VAVNPDEIPAPSTVEERGASPWTVSGRCFVSDFRQGDHDWAQGGAPRSVGARRDHGHSFGEGTPDIDALAVDVIRIIIRSAAVIILYARVGAHGIG
jgi:hypothetical protein